MRNKYNPFPLIIPIGCNCFPAYLLTSTKIRLRSLPFDWLNTHSVFGIKYVYENLLTNFQFFLKDLKKGPDNYIFSGYYPYSIFTHDRDLLANDIAISKYHRRCDRLMQLINRKQCFYLYNLFSTAIKTYNDLIAFENSICDFVNYIKPEDRLLMCITYKESYEENKEFCSRFEKEMETIEKLTIARFLVQEKKYGMWGDPAQYANLLTRLGVRYRGAWRAFIKIAYYFHLLSNRLKNKDKA